MSAITKQAVQAVADLKAGYTLGHADVAILNELARIALASLEAEPVAYVDQFAFHNFSVYRAGETDNKRMGREWMWANPDAGLIPVYTAPPAPVSVKIPPEKPHTDGPLADGWNACRAAMLQGAEPVTTTYKLPELTDSQCLEFLAVAFRHASIKGDIEFDDIRLGLKMALEAAPQQES